MKAIVRHQYGSPDVLRLEEVEKPAAAENRVLVKVHAASLNQYDWHLLTADPFFLRLSGFGFFTPKHPILGADVSGVVEEVGQGVTQYRPGDAVFGCGLGSLAEYMTIREIYLAPKPANLTFEQAAAVPMAALTALQGLRDRGRIQAGQQVLVYGASGGVGSFAVQIAKTFGADVTAVCSTRNLDQARALGADRVMDYTQEDFTQSGQRYDLIFAANGNLSIYIYRRALKPRGTFVMAGGSMRQLFQTILLGPSLSKGDQKMGTMMAQVTQPDLLFLKELLEAGKITPLIDRCYPLEQTVEAFRYLGTGHARGKVVISVGQGNA